MKKWGATLLAAFGFWASYAQSGLYYLDSKYEDDPMDEVTHMNLGMNVLSNNMHLGRKDKNAIPYITPYLGYYFRTGFYINGSVSYGAVRKFGHVDRMAIEGGYDRTWGTNFLAGAYAGQYFYHKQSASVNASITQQAGVYGKYINDLVEPQVDIIYNNTTTAPDYLIDISVDHRFRLADNKLNIYPTFAFFIGTQHFYDNYYISKAARESGATISTAVDNPGNIKPLNVEFSAKATLWAGNWMFTMIPTYTTPLGAGKVTLPTGVISERLKPSFYIELDACYRHPRSAMIR